MKNKKPLWIALGAVAGVFLIAAVIALVAGFAKGGKNTNRSAKDAPYPYSWQEKDGTVVLTLTGKGVENGVWSCVSSTVATVDEGAIKGNKTTFTLTPAEPGREKVTFLLSGDKGLTAEAAFTVEVTRGESEKLSVSIADHEERLLQGTLTGGTDGDYPFTITSQNGVLLLKITDPALAGAFSEGDEKPETSTKPVEPEEPAEPVEPEEPTEPEEPGEEPAEPEEDGKTPNQEDMDDPDNPDSDYYKNLDYDEEANRSESSEDDEPTAFVSDNWHITTSDGLVARPLLIAVEPDGITYRIETDVNGEATVTLYNPVAKVAYVFSLVSRRGALTVSGYQAGEEVPVNPMTREELEQAINDAMSGLKPYTPPPVPEEPEGEQYDGLTEQEQEQERENENEGSD